MMYALKTPSFFRPASRPSSPAPPSPSRTDSAVNSRPLNKLSLSTFRRASPAPTADAAQTPAPLVQDGSYLQMLSLKLSEAVTKAITPLNCPTPAGEPVGCKRQIPSGRGHALGALIASELKAASDNPYLYRAILRSLHRPLSVLLSNLSSQLLPLISSPNFLVPAAPTLQSPYPTAIQSQALAVASFAGELLETFDEFGLGSDSSELRGDGLKQIREGLVSLVQRVVSPLVAGIKNELVPLVDALENLNGAKSTVGKPGVPLHPHPSVATLQIIMPIYARALTRYATSPTSQTILASLLISVIWRAMVALSHRPLATSTSPTSSPQLAPPRKLKSSPSTTPPITPPATRFTIKLPSSRPPSPPNTVTASPAAVDARTVYDLFTLLPRPSPDKVTTKLACEAVAEAFHGLEALPALLDFVATLPEKSLVDHQIDTLTQQLESVTAGLPTLIALPVLLHTLGPNTRSVASYVELSEEEYRGNCLAGFGRADECAAVVGQRVLDQLDTMSEMGLFVAKWLNAEVHAS